MQNVRFMPGEHDASLDHGEAFKEFFGATHYTFDHKGVHFIALDNVSDPARALGDEQLAWLQADLAKQRDASAASWCSPTGRSSTSLRNGTGRRATARRRSSC